MSKRNYEPEENWNEFWKDILEMPDGSIDVEQLKKELSDFSRLINAVPVVYMEATGGRVSKPLTDVDVVCSLIQDHINEMCEQAVEDYKEELEGHEK